jgi:hypothetical protein
VPRRPSIPDAAGRFDGVPGGLLRSDLPAPATRAPSQHLRLSAVGAARQADVVYAFGEARLTVKADGAVYATVPLPGAGDVVQVPLRPSEGNLKGSRQVNGVPLTVGLWRATGELRWQVGEAPKEARAPTSSSMDGLRALMRASLKSNVAERVDAMRASGVAPARLRAAETIAALGEGPGFGTFTFLGLLETLDDARLTDAEASAAPLLYAWLTSRDDDVAASMRSLVGNLDLILARLPSGSDAASILSEILQKYRGAAPDGLALHGLLAGLFGAYRALAETPPVSKAMARIRGWEDSLSCISDPGEKDVATLVKCWWRALDEVADALDPASSLRTRLREGKGAGTASGMREIEAAVTRCALALGEVTYALQHGQAPRYGAVSRTGEKMPTLALETATRGVYVDALTGPLFAGPPSLRNVRQEGVGNCWLVGALDAALGVGGADGVAAVLSEHTIVHPDGTSTRQIVGNVFLPDADGDLVEQQRWVDGRVYKIASGPNAGNNVYGEAFAEPGEEAPIWYPMLEKIVAHVRKGRASYGALTAGLPDEAWSLLYGVKSKQCDADALDEASLGEHIDIAYARSLPLVAGLEVGPERGDHAYAIFGTEHVDGKRYVRLADGRAVRAPPRTFIEATFAVFMPDADEMRCEGRIQRMPLDAFRSSAFALRWTDLGQPPSKAT